jgi:hypothetical protein
MRTLILSGFWVLAGCGGGSQCWYNYGTLTSQNISTSADVIKPYIAIWQPKLNIDLSNIRQITWGLGGMQSGGTQFIVENVPTSVGQSKTFNITDLEVILQDRPLTVTDSSTGASLPIATLRPTDSKRLLTPDRFEGWSFGEDAILWRDDNWHVSHFSSAFARTDEQLPVDDWLYLGQYKWQQGYADLLYAREVIIGVGHIRRFHASPAERGNIAHDRRSIPPCHL